MSRHMANDPLREKDLLDTLEVDATIMCDSLTVVMTMTVEAFSTMTDIDIHRDCVNAEDHALEVERAREEGESDGNTKGRFEILDALAEEVISDDDELDDQTDRLVREFIDKKRRELS